MTACRRLGKLSTILLQCSGDSFFHSSWQNFSSCVKFEGVRRCTASFSSHYRFSIGLRSGNWLGHFKTLILWLVNQTLVLLDTCLGSLSCWNWKLLPSRSVLADFMRFAWRISCIFFYCPLSPWCKPTLWGMQLKNSSKIWWCHRHASMSGWCSKVHVQSLFSPNISLGVFAKQFHFVSSDHKIFHHMLFRLF